MIEVTCFDKKDDLVIHINSFEKNAFKNLILTVTDCAKEKAI